jgi:hypothetical protein
MHTGIALWGKRIEKQGDPYSYLGHLVMFPSGYGFWDLYRRNLIYRDTEGRARKAGKQHDWNRMEILAIGNRIRHVINGKLIEVNVMSPGGIARINRLNGVRLQEKVIDFIEHMVSSKSHLSPRKQVFRPLLTQAEALN